MALLERADTGRRVTWLSLVGLVLIPVVLAAAFVFATWNANDRLDGVRAAIVNNDEGTEIDGQLVPLGRQLAGGLVSTDEDNFDWVLSDDDDAAAGLAEGDYVAVVTIPEGFSEAVMSAAAEDPLTAHQATIDVVSAKSSPLADSVIGQAIAEAARTRFNTEFTAQFMDGIYLGFNEMGDQFREIADAAAELDDGTSQLAEGAVSAATGAGELADGTEQLAAGGGPLSEGATGIADGVSELAGGTRELATGAGELADGLEQMDEGTAELPEQVRQLSDGAGQLSAGVDEYTAGVDEMVRQLSEFASSDEDGLPIDEMGEGLDELAEGSSALAEGLTGLDSGLSAYQDGLTDQAAAAGSLAASNPDLDALVSAGLLSAAQADGIRGQICQGEAAPGTAQCTAMEQVFASGLLAGTQGALDGAAAGLDQKDPATGASINSGLDGLVEGMTALDDGVQELVSGLGDGLSELFDGLGQFGEGADQLLEGSEQLRTGASGLAEGTEQLADGMTDLADGVSASAQGARQLADGTDTLADGVDELATGTDEFAVGVREYTGGVTQLAAGTTTLADGLVELGDGAEQLADGTGQLADGLAEGKDQIPSYTAPERDKLSETVAEPVAASGSMLSSLSSASSVALLLIMALWLGALITYTVVRAVSATAATSRDSSWMIMARGMLPGLLVSVVQGVLLAVIGQIVLDLNFFDFNALLLFAIAAGVVFMVVNYALVAWFGGVGRFISIVLVVLAVAGRALGATPAFFTGIAPFLPLTPAFDGVTAIATGAPGLGGAWGGLLGWLIVGGSAAIIAVARRRTLTAAQATRLLRA